MVVASARLSLLEDLSELFAHSRLNGEIVKVRVVGTIDFFDSAANYCVISEKRDANSVYTVHVDLDLVSGETDFTPGRTVEFFGELMRFPHFSKLEMKTCRDAFFLRAVLVRDAETLDTAVWRETILTLRRYFHKQEA